MYQIIKSLLDRLFAFIIIVALFPLLAITGLYVSAVNAGSPLFSQKRVGRNGKNFVKYMFRTMTSTYNMRTETKYVGKLIRGDYGQHGENVPLKLDRDPRLIPGGRFLRRTGLDQLPLFFNILKGDMSFIGPHPLIPYERESLNDAQRRREAVRPGLVGLAVVQSSHLTWDEMLRLDLKYVNHPTLKMDLYIALKVIPSALLRTTKGRKKDERTLESTAGRPAGQRGMD